MKKSLAIMSVLVIAGCSYGGEKLSTYIDDPKTILEDPLSVGHQDKMDALESSYLRKEITYAEYLERKGKLEDEYTKGVQDRETH